MSVSSSVSDGVVVFPKPIDDVSPQLSKGTHEIMCSREPPHVVDQCGIIANFPSTFVTEGPATELHSQVTEADEENPAMYSKIISGSGSTLDMGHLATPKQQVGGQFPNQSEGHLATPKQVGGQFPNQSEGGATTSQIISDEIRNKAFVVVSGVIEDNPRANGIVLLVHNEDVHPEMPNRSGLQRLRGIENGTKALKNGFGKLGLAVVWLENPSKQLLKAVIDLMSETQLLPSQPPIRYPQSYRYFFFYTTGHGANLVFFTKDGSFAYCDVVNPFRKSERFKQIKYFFFDCCRSLRIDDHGLYPNNDRVIPNVPEVDLQHGECVTYAATGCSKAWGPGGGVSFMTLEMIKLLGEHLSLDELITRLREKVHKEAREIQCPATFSAVTETVNLWSELNEAIRPSVSRPITFESGGSSAHLSVQLLKPPLADSDPNSFLKSCDVQIKRDHGADWESLEPLENGNSTPPELPNTVGISVSLPTDKRTEDQPADFKVVAHFKGGSTAESETVSTKLPDLAKPVCTAVELKGVCCPKLKVTWTQDSQDELEIDNFEVAIRYTTTTHGPVEALTTKDFPVNRDKTKYCESISVPGLSKRDQVVVVVSAKRGNKPQISSDDLNKSFSKEIRQRRVKALVVSGVLLLGLLAISLSVITTNSVTRNNLSSQRKVSIRNSAYEVAYGVQKAFQSFGLSFLGWSVSQCDTDRDSAEVFCAAYNTTQLSSNRRIQYLSPDDTFTELNRTISPGKYSLPFSAVGPRSAFSTNLLQGSLVFVEVCPSITRRDELLHKIEFVVFNNWHALYNFVYNGPSSNQSTSVIATKVISFNYGDACRNYTIQITQSTVVYFAVSMSEVLDLKELSGSIKRLYYSTTGLGLLSNKNRLEDGPNEISGDSVSDLICSAPHSETLIELCVINRLNFNVSFKALVGVSVLIFIIVIVLTCVSTCCICTYVCCRRDELHDYLPLYQAPLVHHTVVKHSP